MLDLAIAIEAIRRHEPTKDVVLKGMRNPIFDGIVNHDEWIIDDGDDRGIVGVMQEEVARLVVEAFMRRHLDTTERQRAPLDVRAVLWRDGEWLTMSMWRTDDDADRKFGDDLLAALMFACGVPLPGEAEGRS